MSAGSGRRRWASYTAALLALCLAAFECWTITSTLARDTERVKVGQMVGCNGFRNPALYAKIASTVETTP